MIRIIIEISERGIDISGIPNDKVSFDFTDSKEYKEKKEKARKHDLEKHLKKINLPVYYKKPITPESKTIHRKPNITHSSRICPKCGKEFIPSGNRQKYCSIECGMKPKIYVSKKLRQEVINRSDKAIEKSGMKKCLECGNWFDPTKTVSGLHDFCSEHCRSENSKREAFKDKPQ